MDTSDFLTFFENKVYSALGLPKEVLGIMKFATEVMAGVRVDIESPRPILTRADFLEIE